MKKFGISRREWLVSAGCLSLSALTGCMTQMPRSDSISLEPYPSNAAEALASLKNGQSALYGRKVHPYP